MMSFSVGIKPVLQSRYHLITNPLQLLWKRITHIFFKGLFFDAVLSVLKSLNTKINGKSVNGSILRDVITTCSALQSFVGGPNAHCLHKISKKDFVIIYFLYILLLKVAIFFGNRKDL